MERYILTVQQSHQECGKREHSVKGLCDEQLDPEVDEGTTMKDNKARKYPLP